MAVNSELAMCDGQLPYLWGWRWREGRVGIWVQEMVGGGGRGVDETKRLGEGMVRMLRIHELVSV